MTNAPDLAHPVFRAVGVQLRAPRVAVIFEGEGDWRLRAREAMRQVTSFWAGAGFVLVPHHAGHVNDVVREWVQAYDPDFIVVASQGRNQPDVSPPDGFVAPLVGSTHAQATFASSPAPQQLGEAQMARRALASVCTPYARWEEGDWIEDLQDLTAGDSRQLRLLSSVGDPPQVCLAVPGSWGGSLATAAAAQVGVLEWPSSDGAGTDDDAAVLAFLLGVPHSGLPNAFLRSPGAVALSVPVGEQSTALQASEFGLTWARRGASSQRHHWVVGSGADDFSVAMIMSRIHRDTTWIDEEWADDACLAATLGSAIDAARPSAAELLVTSVTLRRASLSAWQEALPSVTKAAVVDIRPGPSVGAAPRLAGRPFHHLALLGQHDRRHSMPLVYDFDGTVEMAATPPLPTVEPQYAMDTAHVPVQVDLAVPGTTMPAGRGVDAHAFLRSDDERFHTWVRSSRSGLSYESFRYDFVLAGASAYGRLATPRLTVPGLQPWVNQMAKQHNFEVRLSDPGRRVAVLARLWGGRDAMASAIDSPLRGVLAAFTPPSQSQGSYLEGNGCRITNGRGVISFAGIRSLWDDSVPVLTVRELVDDLVQRRVLRRGLLLRCSDCLRLDFHPVDQLANRVSCDQCSAMVTLAQPHWRLPESEPTWFYDAHPLARQLMSSNSDVPLLLASHLTRAATNHTHIGEIELLQNGKSVVEIDLVTLADDSLSVAEVKTNTDLSTGQELKRTVHKRVLAAQVVRADEIILATTKQGWAQGTIDALQSEIGAAVWAGAPPAVRLISRLGTDDVSDETV